MRNRLLVFGRFAHDPQGVLTAVQSLAFVLIKGRFQLGKSIGGVRGDCNFGLEPSGAFFADCLVGDTERVPYNSQFASVRHNHSVSQARSPLLAPVDFKRHQYPESQGRAVHRAVPLSDKGLFPVV
jgi:hypothetical protein